MEEPPQDRGEPSELQQGRPRAPAYVVLMALFLLRFICASFEDCDDFEDVGVRHAPDLLR